MTVSTRQNFFLKDRAHPIIIAHRGANDHAPENTLAAFREAVKLKADAIELDVQLTKDNEVIVFHDPQLTRMTDGQGLVNRHNYKQIKKLKIDSGTNWEASNQSIPLLYDVLDEFGHTIPFQIELKNFYGINLARQRRHVVEAVIQIIRRLGLENQIMLKSFDPYTVREIKRADKSLVCGYLLIPGLPHLRHLGISRTAFELSEIVEPNRNINSNQIKKYQAMGKKVFSWIVDDPDQAKKLAEAGIDGLVTNHINLVR